MPTWLVKIFSSLIISGIPKLVDAITNFFKTKKRESDRKKAWKKYEKTQDPKDLAAYEDLINNK